MTLHTKTIGIAALAAAAALSLSVPARAVDCQGVHSLIANAASAQQTTSSTSFVALTGATVTTVDGPCIVAHYYANMKAPGGLRVRMKVDGATTGVQPQFLEFRTGNRFDTLGGVFYVPVSNAAHTVTFEFMSLNGSPVAVARQVIVTATEAE
jgi:hypothetical protein